MAGTRSIFVGLVMLTLGCSDAPPANMSLKEAPAPKPAAASPETPAEPSAPAAKTPSSATPVGTPVDVSRERKGLHWTTHAQLERSGPKLEVALTVELHNRGPASAEVSLSPPRITIAVAPIPGPAGEGFMGLGVKGEGVGSNVCSAAHGGPTLLPAGQRKTIERRVALDPLPWPRGQAYRVIARTTDCRANQSSVDLAEVLVIPPLEDGGAPSLQLHEAAKK